MVAHGVRQFMEIGPGTVLTGLVKSIARDVKLTVINFSDAQSLEEQR